MPNPRLKLDQLPTAQLCEDWENGRNPIVELQEYAMTYIVSRTPFGNADVRETPKVSSVRQLFAAHLRTV